MKNLIIVVLALLVIGVGIFLWINRETISAMATIDSSGFFELADWSPEDTTETEVSPGGEASLLSAFFGLDSAAPRIAGRVICPDAPGHDASPVVFSHELDVSTVQAGDFRVVSESGSVGTILCTTFNPANDAGELRTVLLVGDYGSIDDQPVTVEIVGNILSKDGAVNFRGASVAVIPLEAGPSLALAEILTEDEWELGKLATPLPFGGGDGCPEQTQLVVRVTWQGGVTKPGGREVDDLERDLYRVTFADEEGVEGRAPDALADLGDGDNNHKLCFFGEGDPATVSFPEGHMTDPREDLNPATQVSISN